MATYNYGALQVTVTADTRPMAAAIQQVATQAGQQAGTQIGTALSAGFQVLGGTLGTITRAAAAAITVTTTAAVGFGIEAFRTAARVGAMDASLHAMAQAAGISTDTIDNAVESIRQQGIEYGVAQNVAAEFMKNELDVAQATDLARVAQDFAVVSNRNSSDVLDDLIHGISTQNSLVLRNAGVNVQAGQAMDEYAKSIGKSRDQLTPAERAQAVLNAVMEAGSKVAGVYAKAMEEPGKVLTSFPRLFEWVQVRIGRFLLDAFGPLILKSYDLVSAFTATLDKGGALEPLMTALANVLTRLAQPLANLLDRWTAWIKNLQPQQLARVTGIIEKFGPAILLAAGAITVLTSGQALSGIPYVGTLLSALGSPIDGVVKGFKDIGITIASKFLPGILPAQSGVGVLTKALMQLAGPALGPVLVGIAAFAALYIFSPEFRSAVNDLVRAIWRGLQPAFRALWDGIKLLVPVVRELFATLGEQLAPVIRALIPALQPLGWLLGQTILLAFRAAAGALNLLILGLRLFNTICFAVGYALGMVIRFFVWLLTPIINVVKWIFGGSPGLIPAFQALAAIVGPVMNAVRAAVQAAFNAIVTACQWVWQGLQNLWNWIASVWAGITAVLAAPVQRAASLITAAWTGLYGFLTLLWNLILAAAAATWTAISAAITTPHNVMRAVVTGIWNALLAAATATWNAISSVIAAAVTWVRNFVLAAWTGLRAAVTVIWNGITAAITWAVNAVRNVVVSVWGWVRTFVIGLWNGLRAAASATWNAITAAITWAVNAARNAIVAIWSWVRGFLTGLWNGLRAAAAAAWNGISAIVAAACNAIRNAVTGAMNYIRAVVSGAWNFIRAATAAAWNYIRAVITGALNAIRAAAAAAFNWLRATIAAAWNYIRAITASTWNWIRGFLAGTWNAIRAATAAALNWLRASINSAWNWIRGVTSAVWSWIRNFLTATWNAINRMTGAALSWLRSAINSSWNWIRNVTNSIWNNIRSFLNSTWEAIKRLINAALNWLRNLIRSAWDWIRNNTQNTWNAIRVFFQRTWDQLRQIAQTSVNWIRDMLARTWDNIRETARRMWTNIVEVVRNAWEGLKRAVGEPVSFVVRKIINPLIKGANVLLDKIGMKIPEINEGSIPSFQRGGLVPDGNLPRRRYGRDRTLARLEPGEWVLTRRQARAIGYARLAGLPRYQAGGPVGAAPAAWWNPGDWVRGIGNIAGGAFSELLKLGGQIKDEFSNMLSFVAAEAFEKGTQPFRKVAEGMSKAEVPPHFFQQVFGKLVVQILDKIVEFIKSKAAPEFGGAEGVQALAQEVMSRFPGLRITSALRRGDKGYHGRDMARDLGGPVPLMGRAASWMAGAMTSRLLEGIHNNPGGNLSVKNFKTAPFSLWGAKTWAGHRDHIHMAAPNASPAGGGPGGPIPGVPGGRGAARWYPLVARAAQMLGVGHLTNIFMKQLQTESGGNPRAINLWDSNARRGTPSKGLMQCIDPTFNAYAGPYRGRGIWDPWANIYAAINYARSRYGSRISSVLGRGRGYAAGGIITEPVLGIGLRSAVPYTFAERGPERVSPLRSGATDAETRTMGELRATPRAVVNVYPREQQSELDIAAAVNRELGWLAARGGR